MRPLKGLWLAAALLIPAAGQAQVSTNITASPQPGAGLGTTVTPQAGGVYDITGGTRPGNGPNLFHSFGTFNVGAGDVANFRNDSLLPTSNILGRVTGELGTGPQISNVFGTIRTTDFGNANLFLINPAGWVFGPTASLDVGGSFHVSSAHYVRFDDGAQFFADPAQASVLTSAAPAAFGFLGPTGPIVVGDPTSTSVSLSVPSGKILSFVGGDVQISNAQLGAPSGKIQIGSFASAGETSVDGLNGVFSSLGNIQISSSTLTAADVDGLNGGGTVLLRGGDITINNFSFIDTSGTETFDANGNLLATAGGTVVIRGGQLFIDSSTITSNTFGDTNGGPIDVSMSQGIHIANGSSVGTTASADFGFGQGRGGNIQLVAPQVEIQGFDPSSQTGSPSFIVTTTFGTGPAGNVSVQAGTLTVTGSSTLGSSSAGDGRGGDVSILASQSVAVSGQDTNLGPSTIVTASQAGGDAGSLTLSSPSVTVSDGAAITSVSVAGRAGDINVNVARLNINGGATINSHSQGSGGNINVMASDTVTVAGMAANGTKSGILTDTCQTCATAGDISIQANTISVTGGALIESGGEAQPGGGSVTLAASNSIAISAGAGVATRGQLEDVRPITVSTPNLVLDNGFISATTLGPGHGGDIALQVGSLALTQGGQIASSVEGLAPATGNAGNITVNANSVSISGSAPTAVPSTPFNTDPRSGIFSAAHSSGNGNAGQINLAAASLSIMDGGTISVATTTGGAAGNIALTVGSLSMTNGGTVNSSTTASGTGGAIALNASGATIAGAGTGLFSTASSTGSAGQVMLTGGSLTVAGGARISTSTTGAGNAGTITANVGTVTISGGQLDSSTSASGAGGAINVTAGSEAAVMNGGRITADSTGAGRTGNIVVTAGDRITMNGGTISTRAVSSDGGDITLKAPNIVRFENAQITTSVQSGHGSGGNVLIDPIFLVMNNSAITANAFGGPGGNITIIADNFLASSTALLQASSALSTPGTIQIVSPENNVAGSIAQLPRAFVDASRLLRGACSARREGAPSSFVLAGRGGVPADADGYLPSTIASAPPAALALAHLDDCVR